MANDHKANSSNGNFVFKVANATHSLQGRNSGLPIYSVDFSKLKMALGDNIEIVVKSMRIDDEKDMIKGYRQPTNHDDRNGNLPVAPGNGVVYREYFVPGNKLPKPAFLRLIADLHNQRLYITPTHYDVWLQDRDVANGIGENNDIPATMANAMNPFFLINAKA